MGAALHFTSSGAWLEGQPARWAWGLRGRRAARGCSAAAPRRGDPAGRRGNAGERQPSAPARSLHRGRAAGDRALRRQRGPSVAELAALPPYRRSARALWADPRRVGVTGGGGAGVDRARPLLAPLLPSSALG